MHCYWYLGVELTELSCLHWLLFKVHWHPPAQQIYLQQDEDPFLPAWHCRNIAENVSVYFWEVLEVCQRLELLSYNKKYSLSSIKWRGQRSSEIGWWNLVTERPSPYLTYWGTLPPSLRVSSAELTYRHTQNNSIHCVPNKLLAQWTLMLCEDVMSLLRCHRTNIMINMHIHFWSSPGDFILVKERKKSWKHMEKVIW